MSIHFVSDHFVSRVRFVARGSPNGWQEPLKSIINSLDHSGPALARLVQPPYYTSQAGLSLLLAFLTKLAIIEDRTMVVKDQLRWVIFQPIEEFNELEFFLPLKSVNLRNMGQLSWALMYKRSASPPQAIHSDPNLKYMFTFCLLLVKVLT